MIDKERASRGFICQSKGVSAGGALFFVYSWEPRTASPLIDVFLQQRQQQQVNMTFDAGESNSLREGGREGGDAEADREGTDVGGCSPDRSVRIATAS